jgi:hypothetical protein
MDCRMVNIIVCDLLSVLLFVLLLSPFCFFFAFCFFKLCILHYSSDPFFSPFCSILLSILLHSSFYPLIFPLCFLFFLSSSSSALLPLLPTLLLLPLHPVPLFFSLLFLLSLFNRVAIPLQSLCNRFAIPL